MRLADPCGCFPTGRHYPGIAHLIKVRAVGVASEHDAAEPWAACPIAFLDTETTGRDPAIDRIIEIGVVLGRDGVIVERKSWILNPGCPIPAETTAVHGIKDEDVANAPSFAEVAHEILEVLGPAVPAAYNAEFDRKFLLAELDRANIRVDAP